MELKWNSDSLQQTADWAAEILKTCEKHRIFAIYGEMGAGKTTLVKAFCGHLGVVETVKSPTFALVNEYEGKGESIYHFDFYRIAGISEALDIGCEEYFGSGLRCFIEWPEKIEELIPAEACRIEIRETGENSRQISVRFD